MLCSKTCGDPRSLLIVDLDIIVALLSSFALAGGTAGSVRRPIDLFVFLAGTLELLELETGEKFSRDPYSRLMMYVFYTYVCSPTNLA